MGFVNEHVKKEERRTFVDKYGTEYSPSVWTIDREKDEILFWVSTDREPPHYQSFIFYYKKCLVKFDVDWKVKDKICTWELINLYIPSQLNKEEVISELKEAFNTYRVSGSPLFTDDEYEVKFEGIYFNDSRGNNRRIT